MSTLQNTLTVGSLSARRTQTTWWGHLLWLLAAAVLSWGITAIFAGLLQLARPLFLVPYVLFAMLFLVGYGWWGDFDWRSHLVHNWGWGFVGAVVVGAFVVFSVLQQPRTPMPQGGDLLFTLLWLGIVYGMVDGLLLSVMPIVATWQACTLLGWTASWSGKITGGVLALLASLLVTVTYHLGYPEFQGIAVLLPVFGVGVMSVAYLLTRNPVAPVLSHIAMHVAAVLFGLYTAVQLPPHY
jgi:hypothetical protein